MITLGFCGTVLNGNRGSQGAAITLNQEAVIVWKAVGSELHNDFDSPAGKAPDDVWNVYLDKLTACTKENVNQIFLLLLLMLALVWGMLLRAMMVP